MASLQTNDYSAALFKNNTNLTTLNASANHNINSDYLSDIASTINLMEPSIQCIFPSYFSHFAILILIAITIVTQLTHLMKILLMVVVTGKKQKKKRALEYF